MSKRSIFLAAPISGFSVEQEYQKYRKSVLALIAGLRKLSFEVYSEIERISNASDYDSPENSAETDFHRIDQMDVFLLLHPVKEQSSTLIELGYAYAKGKTIVIVGDTMNLPYLVLGLKTSKVQIISTSELSARKIACILSDVE